MKKKDKPVLSIELNEVNFDWLKKYIRGGELHNFRYILDNYELFKTSSEVKYSNLEPWIQWPSFYTGLDYKKHKIFHLGDYDQKKHYSIYDRLNKKGKSFLAISPMNCIANPLNNSKYFPDPWTPLNKNINDFDFIYWKTICKFINNNSSGKVDIKTILIFSLGVLKNLQYKDIFKYIKYIFLSLFMKWPRAIFLDLILFNFLLNQVSKKKYDYISVFLNSAAHIQHHYLYDADIYDGDNKNPIFYSKYLTKFFDPLLHIYQLYDYFLGTLIKKNFFNDYKVLITTGLSQIENLHPYYQYRLNDHKMFLDLFVKNYQYVVPKMSRDFYVYFKTKTNLHAAYEILNKFFLENEKIFKLDIDYKKLQIFVQISFSKYSNFNQVTLNKKNYNLSKFISLISIENSIHQTLGWHVNSSLIKSRKYPQTLKIWSILDKYAK